MWRGRALRSTETEPLPTPDTFADYVRNPACSDPAKLNAKPDLAAACACEAATNSSIELANTYIQQVKDYNTALEGYNAYLNNKADYEQCAVSGRCTGNYASYQSEFDNDYKNEIKIWQNCVPCGTGEVTATQFCNNDFDSEGNGYNFVGMVEGKTKCTAGLCLGKCQRTTSQAQKDWEPVFRGKVETPTAVSQPQVPAFDAQIAITCCSLSFDRFTANSINIKDVAQTCSAEVNKYIEQVENGELPAGTLPPNYNAPPQGDAPEEAPAGLQTFAIVLIIVAVLVFIAMMIWVGVRLRKRKAAKASSSASSDGVEVSQESTPIGGTLPRLSTTAP